MRLIHARTFTLEEFGDSLIPEYAILSHTWEDGEVSFQDMRNLSIAKPKRGFIKIEYACSQARRDHLEHVWVDTCCIDKSSSAELQQAINSMYQWYANAKTCYTFLSNIMGSCPPLKDPDEGLYNGDLEMEPDLWMQAFANSRWFTRGWTLQELLAPKTIKFYGRAWNYLGSGHDLIQTISSITKVDCSVLSHKKPVFSISVAMRMSWAARRETSRVEDRAYSLLGMFGVNMPMLYGEGSKAFVRLQEEILKVSSDHSLLAWTSTNNQAKGSLLAQSPTDYEVASRIIQWGKPKSFSMTNRGLQITLPVLRRNDEYLAILNCRDRDDVSGTFAMRLHRYPYREEYHIATGMNEGVAEGVSHSPVPGLVRLAFVPINEMKTAVPKALEITRDCEPPDPLVKFLFRLEGESVPLEMRTDFNTFEDGSRLSVRSGVIGVVVRDKVRVMALLETTSSQVVLVGFGVDRVQSRRRKGERDQRRLIPGVWARFNKAWQDPGGFLNDICHSESHNHSAYPCSEIGCSEMRRAARIGKPPDIEGFTVQIYEKEIFGEIVFVVDARFAQIYELEARSIQAPEELPSLDSLGWLSSLFRKAKPKIKATTGHDQED